MCAAASGLTGRAAFFAQSGLDWQLAVGEAEYVLYRDIALRVSIPPPIALLVRARA